VKASLRWAAVVALLATACAPSQTLRQPPPAQASAVDDWQYGVYLVTVDRDPAAAQYYVDRAEAEGAAANSSAPLFYRDAAESHLFAGDLHGAAVAAGKGSAALADRPTTAQFQPDDRSLFERDLSALEAAGNDDADAVLNIAKASAHPPNADPWYILGWLREHGGDADGARVAYARYLELSPAWTFLRSADAMRAHAQVVVSR
jgi:hypothetical protein